MLVDIKLYVYCNSQQKEKKEKIVIFHINFENIFLAVDFHLPHLPCS